MSEIISPPSSKSISHRAIICGWLAKMPLDRISNINYCDDVNATIDCINSLEGEETSPALLNCNESGSTLRFFIPLVAAIKREVIFTGAKTLMSRPHTQIATALEKNGAVINFADNKIKVSGGLSAGVFELAGNISSQYISGLIFALPLLEGDSQIVLTTPLQSKKYVDLTINTLKQFNIEIINEDYQRFYIKGKQVYRQTNFAVEADFSAAAFLLVAGAIHQPVHLSGLSMDSLQGDKEILNILQKVGAKVEIVDDIVSVCPQKLRAITVDVGEIPDMVPILAVLMCFCNGQSKIINAGRLRFKESDRLAAITSELKTLGADITEGEDYLIIQGGKPLGGGCCKSHNDHRIAMAIAICSLRCADKVYIQNKECVAKSYPDFFKDFAKIGGLVNE